MKLYHIISIIFCLIVCGQVHAADWMPDPHLERAVRKQLEISDGIPLIPDFLFELHDLITEGDIESLKGMEHAINLKFLHIGKAEVSDLTPLAGLQNLRVVKLYGNRIVDISPLAGLINLEELNLAINNISDISPLAGLINLTYLNLERNQITDWTPLLNLTKLEFLDIRGNEASGVGQFVSAHPAVIEALQVTICDFERPTYALPVRERIENREYPSVFIAFGYTFANKSDLAPIEQILLTDLAFNMHPIDRQDKIFIDESPFGIRRTGRPLNITNAKQRHAAVLRENPNKIFIVEIPYFDSRGFGFFEDSPTYFFKEDSPYWFRNPDGTIASRDVPFDAYWDPLVDFTNPDVIEMTIAQSVAVAKCGLYDGIALDRWHRDLQNYVPYETEMAARDKILQGIRAAVPEDFLIIVNTRDKIPRWAEYVNGIFVETWPRVGKRIVYTAEDYKHYEDVLTWYEANLREPQLTLLRGQVKAYFDAMSFLPKQQMRGFTTLSLTHSDGYILMTWSLPKEGSVYYDFWDAPLGRPVSEKGRVYATREGLFFREFSNGWAVYNRSGKAQEIQLPSLATGWHSGYTGVTHEVPDLDGEIYIKRLGGEADINNDGMVNILDLVMVANAFGEAEPDLNGDGIVNVLDLVRVASQF